MTDLLTFGITVSQLQKYMNPNWDINGFQIGDLFNLEDQLDTTIRTGSKQLTINPGIGAVSAGQLTGYDIILDTGGGFIYGTPYQILNNSKTNASGVLNVYFTNVLPAANGSNWNIKCIHSRTDMHEDDAETELKAAVSELKNRLPAKYTSLFTHVAGQRFWTAESVGYLDNDSLTVTLAFKNPTNIRVWKGDFLEYRYRKQDGILLDSSDYSTSVDGDGYTQLTLAEAPTVTQNVIVDFDHDLDPCPQTLIDLSLELFKVRVYRRFLNVRPQVTLDIIKEMMKHITTQIELGIPEFDAIELWKETKARKQHGIGNIRLSRGG